MTMNFCDKKQPMNGDKEKVMNNNNAVQLTFSTE
jgi:hypothetical protein